MGLLQRLFGLERKDGLIALDPAMYPQLEVLRGYPESRSGISVNWRTALQVTAALRCVQVIANGISQIPLKLYRPRPDGRGSDAATDHPLYRLLYRRPNPWQTSFQFRQTMVFHRALTGNFFAFKNRVGGEIKELIPFDPGSVEVKRNRDLSLTYKVRGHDGSEREFPQDAIWHLRGPSWSSWDGDIPAVKFAREAIGLSLAAEQTQADLHRNGVRTTGVFAVEGSLGGEQYSQLRAWIETQIAGGRGRPFILDRAAKFTPLTMTGVDAQHVETRKAQIEEVCRAFGVFPQMVGHAGDQTPTFASAEQFFIAHVVHTLQPWCEDIEQSIDVDLLAEDDPAYAKFSLQGLLRGAFKDRSEGYAKALGAGGSPAWMTPNDVRGLEEMNPIEGGDELPKPTNPAPAPTPASKES